MRRYCRNITKRWWRSRRVLTILRRAWYVSSLSWNDLMVLHKFLVFRRGCYFLRLILFPKSWFLVIVLLLYFLIRKLFDIFLLLSNLILIKLKNIREVCAGWERWGMWSGEMLLHRRINVVLILVIIYLLRRKIFKLSRLLKLRKSS